MKSAVRAFFLLFMCFCIYACLSGCDPSILFEPVDPMQAYYSILKNQMQFFGGDTFVALEEYIKEFKLPDGTVRITEYAAIDLDADGAVEIVLNFSVPISLILRYKNGVVYGFSRGIREMGNLKKDGSFSWSGGAGYWGFGRFQFSEEKCERVDLAVLDAEHSETTIYHINGVVVPEREFEDYYAAQKEKEDVAWREFSAGLEAFTMSAGR